MSPGQVGETVLRRQRPELPPQLASLILSCRDQDPKRMPTMAKVTSTLDDGMCCFPGTDGFVFLAEIGVRARHRSTASESAAHRRGGRIASCSIDLRDPGTYVRLLKDTRGSERIAVLRELFEIVSDKSDSQVAIWAGVCSTIADLLDEKSVVS
jgi:hypothetical protein